MCISEKPILRFKYSGALTPSAYTHIPTMPATIRETKSNGQIQKKERKKEESQIRTERERYEINNSCERA